LFDIFCVIATKILRRRFRRFLTTNKHEPTRMGFGFMGHFANGRVRQSHQLCSKRASALACWLCLLAGSRLWWSQSCSILI